MVGDVGGKGDSRGNGGNCRCNVEETEEAMAEVAAEKDLWSTR
jgi:hypothetical protein